MSARNHRREQKASNYRVELWLSTLGRSRRQLVDSARRQMTHASRFKARTGEWLEQGRTRTRNMVALRPPSSK
jgi:hypothetical protein